MYEYSINRKFTGRVNEDSAVYDIQAPASAADYIKTIGIQGDEQENMIVLFLDTRNKIKGYQKVTKGLTDRSHAHPREIFRAAILSGASKIILAHNHPSGDTTPSTADIAVTENLVDSGKLLGIKVVDHIIVGEMWGEFEFTSMREQALI
jgi:DNA repair protein RadC